MEEVARWLATSPRHVQRLVTERRIPFVKIGHFVRFDPEDVAGWIEGQKIVEAAASRWSQPEPAHPAGTVGKQSLAPRTTGRQAPSSDNQSPAWMRHRAR
jgi:excisionase family DNA binding protein